MKYDELIAQAQTRINTFKENKQHILEIVLKLIKPEKKL